MLLEVKDLQVTFKKDKRFAPVWGSPSSERVELLPTIPVVSVVDVDVQKIRQALQTGTNVAAKMPTEVLTEWRPIPFCMTSNRRKHGANKIRAEKGRISK